MSSYVTYYLVWMLLAYAVRQPLLLVGVLVFLVFRRYIPDPGALIRAMRRTRSLKHQVAVNAANVTARRDLATLYLDLRRPRAALALIEQALKRDPDDAELLFLSGRALQRAGRNEEALAPLVRAVELRPKLRYGEPYMVAGDALLAVGRVDEATDAYERYARINHSDVGVHVQLARAHAKGRDRAAMRDALRMAIDTWDHIPWSLRRRCLGRWLEAQWLRARLLGDPVVIVTAAAIAGALVFGVRFAAPHVQHAFASTAPLRHNLRELSDAEDESDAMMAAYTRCGSERTGDFEGSYDAKLPTSPLPEDATPAMKAAAATVQANDERRYESFRVLPDRIRSGTDLVQEFCLTRVIERTPTRLHAQVVWHEDVQDLGDACVMEVRIERQGDAYRFGLSQPGEAEATVSWVPLQRKAR